MLYVCEVYYKRYLSNIPVHRPETGRYQFHKRHLLKYWTLNKHINMKWVNLMFFVWFQEPIKAEENIIKFCEESGLPVALDETLDAIKGDFVNHLQKYAHPGIAAIVSIFLFQPFISLL